MCTFIPYLTRALHCHIQPTSIMSGCGSLVQNLILRHSAHVLSKTLCSVSSCEASTMLPFCIRSNPV